MVFSSLFFILLFLPVVLAGYFLLPGLRLRNAWLLGVSLVFYAWGEPEFIFLLLLSTLVNFWVGRRLDLCPEPRTRKLLLTLAIAVNLGFLGYFKYAGLAVEQLNHLRGWCGLSPEAVPRIALPIGISFFTFHALSYLMDIYRRKWRAATNPGQTALYIFFFPQLVAGPILRWNAMAPQFERRQFDPGVFAEGIRRFAGGLGKKVLLANTVAVPADQIFNLPAGQLSTPAAWLGLICYTLQIYFDFSGYSDMAVGLGKMFGFQFIENFDHPYISRSIRDFWRRWHISLSTWFRDYLYIPLGGNRVSPARNQFNLMLVFLLCGLWHGASLTFVAWGLFHGLFLVLERGGWGKWLDQRPRLMQHGYALLVVMGGWVLFRASTFGGAAAYFSALAGWPPARAALPVQSFLNQEILWALGLGVVFSLPVRPALAQLAGGLARRLPEPAGRGFLELLAGVEALLALALLAVSAIWLAGGTYNPFIYFRF